MRSLMRGCAAVAVAGAAVLAGAPPAHADVVFQVQTAATAVHFTLTQQPANSIITASLVDDAAAYTATAFDGSGGGSEAQAASVYPGNLVVQGPALFCSEVFTCPAQPPAYPLLADATYPQRTHDEAAADQKPTGAGPFVVSTGTSTASASAADDTAQTSSGGVTGLGGSAAALTIGASSSTTQVTTTSGSVVVHVEATAHDVTVAGLLHIASVVTTDDVTLRNGAKPQDRPHVVVSGVTVAGVPASIDDTGVHVAGHDGPSLAQQLARNGVSAETVGAQRSDTATAARSVATGLTIDMRAPVSGLPYVPNPLPAPFDQVPGVNANGTYIAHATIGAAGIVAGANIQPAFSLGGLSPLTPLSSAGGSTVGGGNGIATSAAAPAGLPAVAPPPQGAGSTIVRGFLDGFATDLADLYAALALGTALLFIGWRGIIAVRRRPGSGRRA